MIQREKEEQKTGIQQKQQKSMLATEDELGISNVH